MALATRNDLVAMLAASQPVVMSKTAARTTIAAVPFSVFELAGDPGAGVLAGTSVAAGVVPTDATAGCPTINAFTGANLGYMARVDFSSTVAGRIFLYDMLWKGGAYPFNATQTLAAQPSYSSRVPGGTDYTSCEIWLETVTAFTGNQSIAVTYTNGPGTTGKTTGTIATGVAPTLGRMLRLPQADNLGVSKIESVTSTIATVGTFNVLVLRRLWSGRVRAVNDGDIHDFNKTGLVQLYTDSALIMVIEADSTSSGVPELVVNVGNS